MWPEHLGSWRCHLLTWRSLGGRGRFPLSPVGKRHPLLPVQNGVAHTWECTKPGVLGGRSIFSYQGDEKLRRGQESGSGNEVLRSEQSVCQTLPPAPCWVEWGLLVWQYGGHV